MENIKEAIQELVSGIINGNENTGDIFSDILQTKISDRLDALKREVAENMFSSCDDCEAEVLTQEEFDALTEEEQAEYEPFEFDDEEDELDDEEELEENVEQIDEISSSTLQSYRQKAGQSAAQVDRNLHKAQTAKNPNPAAIKSAAARQARRVKGINTASNTLASRNEEVELVDEASYSAKTARAGKDIGKPGKMFAKIAMSAGKQYGSKERGEKVAGAVLKKLRMAEQSKNN